MQNNIFDSFEQDVAADGYEWIEMADGVVALLARFPGRAARKYRPFSKIHSGLFRAFSQLSVNKDSVLAFANEYGSLGGPVTRVFRNGRLTDESPGLLAFGKRVGAEERFEQPAQLGEPFALTASKKREAVLRARLLPQTTPDSEQWTWTAQIGQMASTLGYGEKKLESSENVLFSENAIKDLQGEVIHLVVEKALAATVAPRLQWIPDRRQFRLQLAPASLIGALWLQVAMAFSENKTFKECSVCKRAMEISRGPTGTRSDAIFCSSRCKSRDYRNRKAGACKLARKGLAPAMISKLLRSDAKTVRRWIGED